MTNGTSQGLFIVVAIVIFGIFIVLSNTLFGDQLSNGLSGVFSAATEEVSSNLNGIYIGEDYVEQGDYRYAINSRHNTASIVKYLGTDSDIEVPSTTTVNSATYTVTRIEENAFYGKDGPSSSKDPIKVSLERVVIPDSIEFVGDGAFAHNHISELTLGIGLKTIDRYAFHNNKIEDLVFHDNIEEIRGYAFHINHLTSIVFGNHPIKLGGRVFTENNLNEVYLPLGTDCYLQTRVSTTFDESVDIHYK